eukprot:GHVL01015696.1.p1 GENE.GHVL01015696.1~~GHVL01015696.1.p1  ORF type:complete len:506 (+),score=81.44 GHVL01015696.1:23-1540(+)
MKWQPWYDHNEWLTVANNLLSSDVGDKLKGCQKVKEWRCRGKVPVPVDSTATFMEIMIHDKFFNRHADKNYSEDELQSLYCMAIVKLVSLVVARPPFLHPPQNSQTSFPTWLIDVRNRAAHGDTPMIGVLRDSATQVLDYLSSQYWTPQKRSFSTNQIFLEERIPVLLSLLKVRINQWRAFVRKVYHKRPRGSKNEELFNRFNGIRDPTKNLSDESLTVVSIVNSIIKYVTDEETLFEILWKALIESAELDHDDPISCELDLDDPISCANILAVRTAVHKGPPCLPVRLTKRLLDTNKLSWLRCLLLRRPKTKLPKINTNQTLIELSQSIYRQIPALAVSLHTGLVEGLCKNRILAVVKSLARSIVDSVNPFSETTNLSSTEPEYCLKLLWTLMEIGVKEKWEISCIISGIVGYNKKIKIEKLKNNKRRKISGLSDLGISTTSPIGQVWDGDYLDKTINDREDSSFWSKLFEKCKKIDNFEIKKIIPKLSVEPRTSLAVFNSVYF